MQKIKNFLNNKLNLFAVLVVLTALGFGGYKYYTKANSDYPCIIKSNYITKNVNIQKDQLVGSCSDIVWGPWEKKDNKTEIRKGAGVKTILDYRKNNIKESKKTTWSKIWLTRNERIKRCGKAVNALDTTHIPTVEENHVKTNKSIKINKNLRNDPTAVVYRTNKICQVTQTRPIIPTCKSDGKWSPKPEDKCKGLKFVQYNNCYNSRIATGTKKCDPNPGSNPGSNPGLSYCQLHPKKPECITDDRTQPVDDDKTDGDGFVDTGVGDGDNVEDIKPTNLTSAWSTDKVHWIPFGTNKIALLKTNKEKIYIKTVPEGTCGKANSGKSPLDFFSGFSFNPIKDGKAWMKQVEKQELGNGFLTIIQPTTDAKVGEVFTQPMKSSYCGTEDSKAKELKVKIVNIVQREI